MKAVNLLPTKHRPRTPTGGQQGSAYAVIGVLAGALAMVLLYALTVNGINSRKDSVTRAKAETAQAEARARSLSAYGNFKQVKEQRLQSVKTAATGRIDWERLARGLAHVLPSDVWLLNATATSTGQAEGAAASQGGGADAAAAGSPTLKLAGCAPTHAKVAVALVRLRHLPSVEDVTLANITKPESQSASPGGGVGDSGDCGSKGKHPNFKFEATVTFKPNPGSAPANEKVPAALGGGS